MSAAAVKYQELATTDVSDDFRTKGSSSASDFLVIDDGKNEIQREEEEDYKTIPVQNSQPFAISKPPTVLRDWTYALAFALHFLCIVLLSVVEQNSLHHSLLNYSKAWSWSSMLMIITLMGSFVGAIVSFVIGVQSMRDILWAISIPFSFILKICVGNILLIMRSQFSLLGIVLISSAIIDTLSYKSARENVGFASALVQVAIDNSRVYGLSFFLACSIIVACQTCILLWWGAFFIGLISTVSISYAAVLIIVLLLSLYWITQFFHSLIAFVVGGCILWNFVKDADNVGAAVSSGMHESSASRLLLYVRCALTTSLGSLCKGALLTPIAQTVLCVKHWVEAGSGQHRGSASPCGLRALAAGLLTDRVVQFAQKHHRLALPLLALYGRSLCPTAFDLYNAHQEAVAICIEDTTYFTLNSTAILLAGVIAIVFGLVAEHGEGTLWPLFFFVCFYLAFCGVSISVHVYASAVDALIVASSICPIKFAKENQIIYLRFLRQSEDALR